VQHRVGLQPRQRRLGVAVDDDAGLAPELEQVAEVAADLLGVDVDRTDQLDRGLLQREARSGEADRAETERDDANDGAHGCRTRRGRGEGREW
jgi:hypothetical protein